MRTRIDAACAGFLLANALGYLSTLFTRAIGEGESGSTTWLALAFGMLISLVPGLNLLLWGWHARLVATAACVIFLAFSFGAFFSLHSHGVSSAWTTLASPTALGSLVALAALHLPRERK